MKKLGDDPGGCVLNNRMWSGVVQSGPVVEGMGPYVCAEKILALNCYGYIGEDGLDISLDGVLPLLIWRGAFMSTLVFLVEKVGFVGTEGCVIVAP